MLTSTRLDTSYASGTGVASGAQVTSSGFAGEARAGRVLHIYSPAELEGTYTISRVQSDVVTLKDFYADPVGVSFILAPDLSGYSCFRALGGGSSRGFFTILETELGIITTVEPFTEDMLVQLREERVVFETRNAHTDALLEAVDSPGATALGLAGLSTSWGHTFSVPAPLQGLGVRVGDLALLTNGSLQISSPITDFDLSTLTLLEPAPHIAGDWVIEIYSQNMENLLVLQEGLDIPEAGSIARTVDRLIQGAKYTTALQQTLEAYEAKLLAAEVLLGGYEVSKNQSMSAAVKAFREQGLDRALDILLSLDFEKFYLLDDDGVSYATHLMRQTATTSRELAPITTAPRSQQGVSSGSID